MHFTKYYASVIDSSIDSCNFGATVLLQISTDTSECSYIADQDAFHNIKLQ